MRLHRLEIFGFVGQAVALLLFWFWTWQAGLVATLIAAPPLFIGQQIRHRQELDELRRRFP